MDKELKCPKCWSENRVKGRFNKKQRYLYQKRKYCYTVEYRGYPEQIGRKAIELYLKEIALAEPKEFLKLAIFLSKTG